MNSKRVIDDALILLAGAGSRLATARASIPKPLVEVRGRPLISYVLRALESAGVRTVHAVVGSNAEEIITGVESCLPRGIGLNPIHNRQWQKQNGISVLSAATLIDRPFLLTMGDHLFETSILRRLLEQSDIARLNLAVDRKIQSVFDLADAMKVRTSDGDVVAISKTLSEFDAIDTGLFLCPLELFDYLERGKTGGDCSLADGVQLMACDRKVAAIDIRDAWWQDVDTLAMLYRAERDLPDSLLPEISDARKLVAESGRSRKDLS